MKENNYFPFCLRYEGYNNLVNGQEFTFRYNGKELNEELGLGWYDYGARFYDAALGRWMAVDPLAEKYPSVSTYTYVLNNPVFLTDPTGMAPEYIIGRTKKDAEKVHADFNEILSGKQFTELRGLITRGKKNNQEQFDKINKEALDNALSGLSGDDLALAQAITDAINSKDKHIVEFVNTKGNVSKAGTSAIKAHFKNTMAEGVPEKMIQEEAMTGSLLHTISGGGLNVPISGGSYSFISEGIVFHEGGKRSMTTGHEIIGHGVAAANKVFGVPNNTRAIRVENLMKRVMGVGTPRTEHGGAEIVNPNELPKRIGN